MKKITKVQINILKEFTYNGEVCARISSDWTRGRGRYITKAPLPVYSDEMYMDVALKSLNGRALREVQRLHKDHPRAQRVIVITNLRSANKLLKENHENKNNKGE